MKPINSVTFSQQLEAAGLLGLPFSWGDDGTFVFDPRMTQEQIDGVLAVYDAHDPDIPVVAPFDGNLVLVRMAAEFSMARMYALKNSYGILRDFILFENFVQLKQYINVMINAEEATRDDYNKLNSILKEQGIDLDEVTITSDVTVQITTTTDIVSDAIIQATNEQAINSDTTISEG